METELVRTLYKQNNKKVELVTKTVEVKQLYSLKTTTTNIKRPEGISEVLLLKELKDCQLNIPKYVSHELVKHEEQSIFDVRLLVEYIDGASLKNMLDDRASLPIPKVKTIIKDISYILYMLHLKGIVHQDVKDENILFNGKRAYLIDFGYAAVFDNNRFGKSCASPRLKYNPNLVFGTPLFTSPQLLSRGVKHRTDAIRPYLKAYKDAGMDPYKNDVWSFGVTIFLLVKGVFPFGNTAKDLNELAMEVFTKELPKTNTELDYLLSMCLEKDDQSRWDAGQVYNYALTL